MKILIFLLLLFFIIYICINNNEKYIQSLLNQANIYISFFMNIYYIFGLLKKY